MLPTWLSAWLGGASFGMIGTKTRGDMRVCSISGCPVIYNGTDSRCPTHQTQARAKRIDNRVYSSAGHRRFRAGVLNTDPICVLCERAQSTVADHYPLSRRDLDEQGFNPNDPVHGRGLCASCHNAETARLQPGGWNVR